MSIDGNVSAADLVLDLLEAHDGHQLSVQDLTRGAELFDIQEQAVRVALTRLVKQNKVDIRSRGVYALNTGSSTLLNDVENWLQREQQAIEWNGRWIGISDCSVARADKVAWRRHQRALALRGFRALQDGFHLRPDNLRGGAAALRQDLDDLGLAASSLVLCVTDLDEADERNARGLWDIEGLEQQYRTMLDVLAASQQELAAVALEEAARQSLLIGRAVIRLILHDPLLPDELMGGNLRAQLIARMRDYQSWAKARWMELLGSA
jgi:phenylacetic acid degradation operon negative regulatory protein